MLTNFRSFRRQYFQFHHAEYKGVYSLKKKKLRDENDELAMFSFKKCFL